MRVVFRPDAESVLDEVADFIDGINIEGSGGLWTERFIAHVYTYALPNVTYALCKDQDFAAAGLSCINYNDWIIAFKIQDDLLIVHEIIRGNILT
jgi:hypothetical protein